MDSVKRVILDKQKDSLFVRNTAACSGGELFWGIGLPVVVESTFLQVFLHTLGASNLVIGLIPTFFFLGTTVFGVFSGYFTGHVENKRKALIISHLFGSLPIPIFGLILYISGTGQYTLVMFLCFYALFCSCIGLMLPIWQNYLLKLFSEKRVFSGLAIIMFSQSAARLFSSFVILKVVRRYSMESAASAVVFIGVGGVFFIGTLLYFFTWELSSSPSEKTREKSFFSYVFRSVRVVFGNKRLIKYLVSDLETFAIIGIVSFYATYAVEYCFIDPAFASGLFIIFFYTGQITVHALFGWFNFFSLKHKFMIGKITGLISVAVLFFFQSLWAFLVVSYLIGVSRGVRHLAFSPAVKRLAGTDDATVHLSIVPVIVLPVSAGLPFLVGFLLDTISFLNGLSYRLVFLFYGLIMVMGLIFLLKTSFPPEHKQKKRN